jgi:hypothetical protein
MIALELVPLAMTTRAADEPPAWKAGAAAAKITPETSMWMAGYASRTKPSEGVELDLFAKALVLVDADGEKFALLTMDLIGVPRTLRLVIAERVEQQYGIKPSHLTINASHTHSGPELKTSRLHGVDDVALRQQERRPGAGRLLQFVVRFRDESPYP